MKNSFKLFILGLVTMVFLAACGQDTKDIEVKEEENQQENQQGETTQQEETAQPEEAEKEEETQSKLGSRTNPVPFQKTATVDEELYDSESEDIYSGDVYGTTEPDFSFEMYVGSEKEGYISGLVKTGEKAQLRYEEIGSFRMEKKKANKPVTATAIAASAFGAVTASPTDAASSSVDKSVKKATDQMRKAYNTYMQAAKSGKLASYSAVKKRN